MPPFGHFGPRRRFEPASGRLGRHLHNRKSLTSPHCFYRCFVALTRVWPCLQSRPPQTYTTSRVQYKRTTCNGVHCIALCVARRCGAFGTVWHSTQHSTLPGIVCLPRGVGLLVCLWVVRLGCVTRAACQPPRDAHRMRRDAFMALVLPLLWKKLLHWDRSGVAQKLVSDFARANGVDDAEAAQLDGSACSRPDPPSRRRLLRALGGAHSDGMGCGF